MKLLDTFTFSNLNEAKPTNYFESIGAFNYDYIYLHHKNCIGTVYKCYQGIIQTTDLIIGNATSITIPYNGKNLIYGTSGTSSASWRFAREGSSDTSNIIEIYGIVM